MRACVCVRVCVCACLCAFEQTVLTFLIDPVHALPSITHQTLTDDLATQLLKNCKHLNLLSQIECVWHQERKKERVIEFDWMCCVVCTGAHLFLWLEREREKGGGSWVKKGIWNKLRQ